MNSLDLTKRRIVLLLFVALFSLLIFFSVSSHKIISAEAAYNSGTGSVSNPFVLKSPEHFVQLHDDLLASSNGLKDIYFEVSDDVDFSVQNGVVKTIGYNYADPENSKAFQGVLNGKNNILYNMSTDNADNNQNFFSLFYALGEFAKVNRLGIYNLKIETNNKAAGIAVTNKGIIDSCFVSGNINSNQSSGGIVAVNDGGSIIHCYTAGTISSVLASTELGGLVGKYSSGIVEKSYSLMKVFSTATGLTANMGGIIGKIDSVDASKITKVMFGYYNQTNIKSKNGFNENVNDKKERGRDLYDFQSKSLTNLFAEDEINWEKTALGMTTGEAIYSPIIKSFKRAGVSDSDKKHNAMLKYSASVKFYGYDEKYKDNWGTAENPCLINSIDQIYRLSDSVLAGREFLDKHFKLNTENLDFGLAEADAFPGIGTSSTSNPRAFRGTFDGDFKTIPKILIQKTTANDTNALGLFNFVDGGTVKNIILGSECIIDGTRIVDVIGGLVGYAKNANLTNILVSAKLRNPKPAQYVGGVVGRSLNSKYQTVMFNGTMELDADFNEKIGGVSANEEGSAAIYKNTWHFINYSQLYLYGDNYYSQDGKIFLDETPPTPPSQATTTVSMKKITSFSHAWSFEFNTSGGGAGSAPEYRDGTEQVFAQNAVYASAINESNRYNSSNKLIRLFYARHVTQITIKVFRVDATNAESEIAISKPGRNYYSGEKTDIFVDLIFGTYLQEILQKNVSTSVKINFPITNLHENNFYNKVGLKGIVFGQDINRETVEIVFKFKEIVIPNDFFGYNSQTHEHIHEYKGVAVEVENIEDSNSYNNHAIKRLVHYENITDSPNGIKLNYTALPPKDANDSTIPSYFLDYIFYIEDINGSKIYLGKTKIEYKITKKVVSIPSAAYDTKKEYNGVVDYDEPLSVNLAVITDIFVIDKNIVKVDGKIRYDSTMGIGTANLLFSIHDAGLTFSKNYTLANPSIENVLSTIVKRKIYIPIDGIESLEKEYDQIGPALVYGIENQKNKNPEKTLISHLDIKPSFTRETGELAEGMPGKFKISLSFTDADKNNYFEIGFSQTKDSREYIDISTNPVIYTIRKRTINATFENISGLVYDGENKINNISAKFMPACESIPKSLNFTIKDSEDTTVEVVTDAGTYTISAIDYIDSDYTNDIESLTHKYYVNPEGLSQVFIISKANQVALQVTSNNTYEFSSESYILMTEGGSPEGGDIVFEIVENAENTALAEVLENTLKISRAGVIYYRAKRLGGKNYNEVVSDAFKLTITKGHVSLILNDSNVEYGLDLELSFSIAGSTELPHGFIGPDVMIHLGSKDFPINKANPYDVGQYNIFAHANTAFSDVYIFNNEIIRAKLNIGRRNVRVEVLNDIETTYGTEVVIPFTTNYDKEIVGSLGRSEGSSVGSYNINGTTMIEQNPSLNIEFNFEGKYVIKKANLTMKFISASKFYSEVDPVPSLDLEGLKYDDSHTSINLQYTTSRDEGELPRPEGYNFYATNISHTSNNYNEVVFAVDGTLKINKANAIIEEINSLHKPALALLSEYDESIDGKIAKFSIKVFDVETGTWQKREVAGAASWESTVVNKSLDFRESDRLVKNMVFTIDSSLEPNAVYYYNTRTSFSVEILPIKLDVGISFALKEAPAYKGSEFAVKELCDINFTENIALNSYKLVSNKTIKDAGSYTVTVESIGYNYNFTGTKSINLTVKKADLTISFQSLTYKDNEKPKVHFIFNGFIAGENETYLSTQPSVLLPQEAGNHKIMAYGASSSNYNMIYTDVNVVVKKHVAISKAEDDAIEAKIYGAYEKDLIVTIVQNKDSKRIAQTNSQIKRLAQTEASLKNQRLDFLYQVEAKKGGEVVSKVGSNKIELAAPEKYINSDKVAVMIVDINGKTRLANATVSNGVLSVEGDNIEYVAFLEKSPPYILYAGIGAGAILVVVLVAMFIAYRVRKRRESRYIQFKQRS